MPVGAILLAAGESTRMGTLKALLPWGGTTLLEYQLAQVRASRCDGVVVVLGHQAASLLPLVGEPKEPGAGRPWVRAVVNPAYRSGKCSSIRAGLAALPEEVSAALILAVDQPRPAWLLDRLIAEHERGLGPIVLPAHAGRRGHPPLFGATLFPELRLISEERQGLREVLARHAGEARAVEIASPIVHVNLNRPEDYAAARALLGPD